jgi:biotin transport system substrate-specific component
MSNEKIRKMAVCGMFTAILCVCPAVTLSIGPVPITLQTLFVSVTGIILGKKWGPACVAAYLLLGVAGLPVFAGFKSGLAVLAGPTGGYLTGFLPGVFVIGLFYEKLRTAADRRPAAALAAIFAGEAVIFTCGCVQLAVINGLSLLTALQAGAVPFIVPEILKMAGALFVASSLERLSGIARLPR